MAGVHVWFLMAGHTFVRGTGKKLVDVATLALGSIVRPVQHKGRIVIEIHHTIVAVVAIETILAKTFRVLGDEISGHVGVASDTVHPLGAEPVFSVAIGAGDRRTLAVGLMADEAKARQPLVVHVGKRQRADGRILPLVLDVAILAFSGARQEAVQ